MFRQKLLLTSVVTVVASVTLVGGLSAQAKLRPMPISEIMPSGMDMDEFVVSHDRRHTYYIAKDQVWLYDHASRTSSLIASGAPWDLTIAANDKVLAYTRDGEDKKDEFIWTIPLDPATGRASGAPRRVSMQPGDPSSISPDGSQIAFSRDDDNGQSLLVLPLAGGPERVLYSVRGTGIATIAWTPDSKTLYFGITPARTRRGQPGSIQRVPVAGGTPTIVVANAVGSQWPGLSPNGRIIVFGDTGVSGRMVVTDSNGKRLGTFVPPGSSTDFEWLSDQQLLIDTYGRTPAIMTYSLADGVSHPLIDSVSGIRTPIWSPDGKRIAFVHRGAFAEEIIVANADGSRWRHYAANDPVTGFLLWSPDGRFIAYRGHQQVPTAVNVIDLSTGRERAVMPIASYEALSWSGDSKHLYVTTGEPRSVDPTVGPPPGPRHLRVFEVGLDGTKRVLRDTTLSGYSGLTVANARTLLVRGDISDPVSAIPLEGAGRAVQLVAPNSGFVGESAFSPDGQWFAARRNIAANDNHDMRVLDVVRLDGTQRTSVTLPFAMVGGPRIAFLPGNKQLLVADSSFVYRVSLPNGEPAKLFEEIGIPRFPGASFSLSPDGRTVLYATLRDTPPSAFTLNVGTFAKP